MGTAHGHRADDTLCPFCGHPLSTFTEAPLHRGERAAEGVEDLIASWWFLASLLTGITAWVAVNVIARPFEPYPTVMLAGLGAALATVAGCQGPLILLGQRRAMMRDRARDRETYRVAAHTEADVHALRHELQELQRRLADERS